MVTDPIADLLTRIRNAVKAKHYKTLVPYSKLKMDILEVLKKNKKPLIMLRSGITEQGKRSVNSHTGSLTTSRQIWNAVYTQTNVVPVRSLEELIETTQAFYYCKDILPKVNGIILITWSGGTATVATDLISETEFQSHRLLSP